MSELETTLWVVSCLAALGLGLSGGMVCLWYTQYRPMIRAYQAKLDTLQLERNEYKKAATFWANLMDAESPRGCA